MVRATLECSSLQFNPLNKLLENCVNFKTSFTNFHSFCCYPLFLLISLKPLQFSILEDKFACKFCLNIKIQIRSLQSKLASMSTNFKTTLETRRESMNQQRDRRNQFNGKSTIQTNNTEINLQSSVLYNDDQRYQKNESRKDCKHFRSVRSSFD